MNKVDVKFIAEKGAIIPEYKTSGAAGADVCAFLNEPVTISAGCSAMISTGLYFEIPEGYEIQVRPRSGLAAKNGVTVLNTPGTINLGAQDFTVHNGDRIAQIIIAPVTQAVFLPAENLSRTERGTGGFGSTGL